jgi:purine catabolism regulator
MDDPTPWMVQGSLLLTTGPKFEEDPQVAVDLVRLLRRSGMVGIGVAITPHVTEVPVAAIEAAEAAGLPLLRIPRETPFRKVTSYVSNALASRDMHRLRRSVALQERLLELLVAENDIGGFIARLGDLLGVTTVLLGVEGQLVARSAEVVPGDADPEIVAEAWAGYRAVLRQDVPRSVLVVAGRNVAFRQVRLGGAVVYVLLAVYPPDALIPEFPDASLSFVQHLLEMELATTDSAAALRRRTRARLLEMLLGQRGGAADLAERLVHHGIEADEEWRIIALSVVGDRGTDPAGDQVLATVDAVLEERPVPFVSCRQGGRIMVMSHLGPPPDDLGGARRVVTDLAVAVQGRLRVRRVAAGLSTPMSGAASVPRAAGQARLALDRASSGDAPGVSVVAFDELGAAFELLDATPDHELSRLARRVFGRVRVAEGARGGDLTRTLLEYLDQGCSVADAAARLYVHRNTLRKRLARIGRLTGVDLGTTGGRVDAYLSVSAARILAQRGEDDTGAANGAPKAGGGHRSGP